MEIYNLKFSLKEFSLLGYKFNRISNYNSAIEEVYTPSSNITEYHSETGEEKKYIKPEQLGRHICTYEVKHMDLEPQSIIFRNDKALTDIIYLIRLFSGKGAYLDFELNSYPPYYHGIQAIPDNCIPAEIEKIFSSIKPDTLNKLDLAISLNYYFRSNSSNLLNFATTDLAIAWEIISTKYYAMFSQPTTKRCLLTKEKCLLKFLGWIISKKYVHLIRCNLIKPEPSLFDKAWFMLSHLGIDKEFDQDIAQYRIRVFLGFLRAKAVHTGKISEIKSGFSKRAQDYLIFAMKDLLLLVYLKILKIDIKNVRFSYTTSFISDCKAFFSQKDPKYRGEKPFTENDSRFEKEWNDVLIESQNMNDE